MRVLALLIGVFYLCVTSAFANPTDAITNYLFFDNLKDTQKKQIQQVKAARQNAQLEKETAEYQYKMSRVVFERGGLSDLKLAIARERVSRSDIALRKADLEVQEAEKKLLIYSMQANSGKDLNSEELIKQYKELKGIQCAVTLEEFNILNSQIEIDEQAYAKDYELAQQEFVSKTELAEFATKIAQNKNKSTALWKVYEGCLNL